jgi:CRISPR-associated exonuclease Cas4
VQLCAQAICLEEMLGIAIPAGALFYGQTRHRLDVAFDKALRWKTEETARQAHELIASGRTPPPVYEKRCESCSLVAECLPKTIQKRGSVKSYMSRILNKA